LLISLLVAEDDCGRAAGRDDPDLAAVVCDDYDHPVAGPNPGEVAYSRRDEQPTSAVQSDSRDPAGVARG
jgi:hypothetical protein